MKAQGRASEAIRWAGAAAILAGGALHLRLALDHYGTDDLVTLFFLNAIGSALAAVGVTFLRGPLPLLPGLAIAGVSLVALALSRVGDGVVGFRGVGLDPAPDVALTIAAEAAAVLLLGGALLAGRSDLLALGRRLRG